MRLESQFAFLTRLCSAPSGYRRTEDEWQALEGRPGLAEHETVGGFFGGSFTVQLASPPFFILGSEIRAVAV